MYTIVLYHIIFGDFKEKQNKIIDITTPFFFFYITIIIGNQFFYNYDRYPWFILF